MRFKTVTYCNWTKRKDKTDNVKKFYLYVYEPSIKLINATIYKSTLPKTQSTLILLYEGTNQNSREDSKTDGHNFLGST